ncbi:UNVERIFIED_CONTAM: hypothetical protein RMT77_006805 [Armadillidium vulgare]
MSSINFVIKILIALAIEFSALFESSSQPEEFFLQAGFAIFDQKLIDLDQSYKELVSDSNCKCQYLCFTDNLCKSYGVVRRSDDVICQLADDIYNFGVAGSGNYSRGTIYYKLSDYFFFGKDNRFYHLSNTFYTFNEAVEYCSSKGNFQVGLYKTLSEYDSLVKAYNTTKKELWVDMDSVPESPHLIWSDGTWFKDTELALRLDLTTETVDAKDFGVIKVRLQNQTTFNDAPSTRYYSVLCQGTTVFK